MWIAFLRLYSCIECAKGKNRTLNVDFRCRGDVKKNPGMPVKAIALFRLIANGMLDLELYSFTAKMTSGATLSSPSRHLSRLRYYMSILR
jgi:hypothetical protein